MSEFPTLRDRRILVLGASAGIGRAFATQAVAQGARVCASARRADRLRELGLDATGGAALPGDMADAADARRVVEEAARHLGGFDLVLYAAGVASLGPLSQFDAAAWRRDYDVNVIGANAAAAAALPHLVASGIVSFLSSENATETRWGMSSYSATKAALDASIRYWQHEHPELRFQRVIVGATMPTEFGDAFAADVLTTALGKWVEAGIPMGAMETEDVGRQLAELTAMMLSHPGIDTSDVRLRPLGAAPPVA